MKLATVTLLLSFIAPLRSFCQCTEMQLSTLQVVQKAEPLAKENEILQLGFDLKSEQGTGGNNVRKYVKCWDSTNPKGKTYYDQVILWYTNTNIITFLTLNTEAFSRLRKAVEERHPGSGGQQTVHGKQFRYTFVTQDVDGREYQGLTVALRNQ